MTLFAADALHQIVGEDRDIIGFDPRGIGFTTPHTDCFSSPYSDSYAEDFTSPAMFKRLAWQISGQEIGLVNSSSIALTKLDNRARSLAMLCKAKDDKLGKDSIFRHVSTPNVARDMLSIVDAWDAWRDEQKGKKQCTHEKATARETIETDETGNPALSSDDDTKGKLVYWGFSYGTLLGATFAAMFPDRVGRVILDGVVDADAYVEPIWYKSLEDTDKNFKSFFRYCHKATHDCKFWRNSAETESEIEQRGIAVMEDLASNPIVGINQLFNTPSTFTISSLKSILFSGLYAPIAAFPGFATIFDALERRQHDYILSIIANPSSAFDFEPFCNSNSNASHTFGGMNLGEATPAIMCSDKRYTVCIFLTFSHSIYRYIYLYPSQPSHDSSYQSCA